MAVLNRPIDAQFDPGTTFNLAAGEQLEMYANAAPPQRWPFCRLTERLQWVKHELQRMGLVMTNAGDVGLHKSKLKQRDFAGK